MIKCKCEKINFIHGAEAKIYASSHLQEISVNFSTWETLYQCPVTKRFWKEYFPYPEAHGGGPPELIQITPEQAEKDFDLKK